MTPETSTLETALSEDKSVPLDGEAVSAPLSHVEVVNALRSQVGPAVESNDFGALSKILSEAFPEENRPPQVDALLTAFEMESFTFESLEELNLSPDTEFLMGFFESRINRDASFEAARFEVLSVPESLQGLYPNSLAVPATSLEVSDGLDDDKAVAVFPKDYRGLGSDKEACSIYFIDKFVKRAREYSVPFLISNWDSRQVKGVVSASDAELTDMAACWVHCHEYFHQEGFLPYERFAESKGSLNAAALEELRVDLETILALLELSKTDGDFYHSAAMFVLFERLVRYPLQFDPKSNADARASITLFNFLFRRRALRRGPRGWTFVGGTAGVQKMLQRLSRRIDAFEFQLLEKELTWQESEAALSAFFLGLARIKDSWTPPSFFLPGAESPRRPLLPLPLGMATLWQKLRI